jgi:hypothetical protein
MDRSPKYESEITRDGFCDWSYTLYTVENGNRYLVATSVGLVFKWMCRFEIRAELKKRLDTTPKTAQYNAKGQRIR